MLLLSDLGLGARRFGLNGRSAAKRQRLDLILIWHPIVCIPGCCAPWGYRLIWLFDLLLRPPLEKSFIRPSLPELQLSIFCVMRAVLCTSGVAQPGGPLLGHGGYR